VSLLASLRSIGQRARLLSQAPPREDQQSVEAHVDASRDRAQDSESLDAGPLDPIGLTPDAVSACRQRRQGDVVQLTSLPVLEPNGTIRRHPAPNGVVILSQTCDVVLPDRLTVVAAPLVRLSGDVLRQATKGGRPRYVAVPAAGVDAFADLDIIGTLDKNILAGTSATDGTGPADADIRRFGQRVARRFGRFPFPDEVVPWLLPLTDIVAGKYGKGTGEARALEQVVELRVEATGGWTTPPYALTLVTIVRAGTLPELDEKDQIDPPPSLQRWLREPSGRLRRTSGEIANRIFAHELDPSGTSPIPAPIDRYHLWLALAEAWAAKCAPRGSDKDDAAVAGAVAGGEIAADILSDDEYPLARYRRSERLDVEHLSPPAPA
jgi:hypothetical protein